MEFFRNLEVGFNGNLIAWHDTSSATVNERNSSIHYHFLRIATPPSLVYNMHVLPLFFSLEIFKSLAKFWTFSHQIYVLKMFPFFNSETKILRMASTWFMGWIQLARCVNECHVTLRACLMAQGSALQIPHAKCQCTNLHTRVYVATGSSVQSRICLHYL